MPVIDCVTSPRFRGSAETLMLIAEEVVPAGLNAPNEPDGEGKLYPGNIEFLPKEQTYGIKTDVYLEIKAYSLPTRAENREERTAAIKAAFNELMPGVTFAVFIILVTGGWASDDTNEKTDDDMSMAAAIERARKKLYARPASHAFPKK